jgi:hypothetical protein
MRLVCLPLAEDNERLMAGCENVGSEWGWGSEWGVGVEVDVNALIGSVINQKRRMRMEGS